MGVVIGNALFDQVTGDKAPQVNVSGFTRPALLAASELETSVVLSRRQSSMAFTGTQGRFLEQQAEARSPVIGRKGCAQDNGCVQLLKNHVDWTRLPCCRRLVQGSRDPVSFSCLAGLMQQPHWDGKFFSQASMDPLISRHCH